MHLGPCVMVYLHCHTHTYLRAPDKTLAKKKQSPCHPSLTPQACAEGNLSWCLLKCLFSPHLTEVLWHRLSFLHGGLVWNYFLPCLWCFLGRRWVGGGKGTVAFATGEETFLSLTCSSNLRSLSHPMCNSGVDPQVALWSPSPSWCSLYPSPERPSVLLAPSSSFAASVPTTRCPGSKMPLILQKIICLLCSIVNPSSEGTMLLSCMTLISFPSGTYWHFCKHACFARKAAELILYYNLMPCYPWPFLCNLIWILCLERTDCHLLYFVSGKSISEDHSWHVPDSPSCPKHHYKQMGGDRNVQTIPSDSSTPYKPAYVSLGCTENITQVHD